MAKPAKERDPKIKTPAEPSSPPDQVEEASEESFPASDSPAWIFEEPATKTERRKGAPGRAHTEHSREDGDPEKV